MSVAASPDLLAALNVARLEALLQRLAGGAVVCYPAPRPPDGGAAAWPPIARMYLCQQARPAVPSLLLAPAAVQAE